MTVKTHIATSALLAGGLYAAEDSLAMAAAALLSGIFIDVDHLFDYLLLSDERFSIRGMFSWCDEGRWERIILFFHSYEFYALFGLYLYHYPDPILTGIFYGVGLHLLLDQIGNRYLLKNLAVNPLFYFITYRAMGGFRKEFLRVDKRPV